MATNTSHLGRGGLGARRELGLSLFLLGVAAGCPVEPFDPASDESSDDGFVADESGDGSEGDGGSTGQDGPMTTTAPGRSDGESESESGESETSAEDGSTSSSDEPSCIDAHFVVFVAPGGEPHVEVPAGLQVARTFADDTMEPAECQLTGGRGECIMACIPSETHIEAIQFDWPCAGGTTASVRVQTPDFVVEIEVAAVEASSGCA